MKVYDVVNESYLVTNYSDGSCIRHHSVEADIDIDLTKLAEQCDREKIEEVFNGYELIQFEGRTVFAISGDDIADAIIQAIREGKVFK